MADIRIAGEARDAAVTSPLFRVAALSKSFGRVAAISNLSFSIDAGEIVGLIGPIGSTVIDLLAGKIKPTFGRIMTGDRDITQLGCDARTRCGVVRASRPADLFPDLTALENVLLGSGASSSTPFFSRRGGKTYHEEAAAVLEWTGLADLINTRAGDLSPSEQRFLTIAVALAAKPSLLLLDSPDANLGRAERGALASLIADIRGKGTSVLISERHIWPLMDICDRILVLVSGRLMADDVPSRVTPFLDTPPSRGSAVPSPDPMGI